MIFLFCSVYSTCRCPFFFAKLLPGRMVKYRHANRQRTERQLSANQRFGYFINSSVCFLALSPSFRSLLMHEKISSRQEEPKGFKRREEKQVEQIISLRMELHRLSENEQAFVECFSRFVNGQMGSAAKVGNALADDHRYLINEKGKVVFAFLERLANDYQKGRYDQRDEWVCRLAAEAIEHLVENRMYYRTLNND